MTSAPTQDAVGGLYNSEVRLVSSLYLKDMQIHGLTKTTPRLAFRMPVPLPSASVGGVVFSSSSETLRIPYEEMADDG